MRFEQFESLGAHRSLRHAFTRRIPGIDVAAEKPEVLARLDKAHAEIRRDLRVADMPVVTAEQVHGASIGCVTEPLQEDFCFSACDALITDRRGVCLGIYVADCCAVYLFDARNHAIGLVHSGRKGTELKIAAAAISEMRERFGSDPVDLIAQLSPCIRSPHYEVDFAREIREQLQAAGVRDVHDCGTCTACDLQSYYSYRAEHGKTGRMLALLALAA